MNEPETRRLLGFISAGYDNRVLSEATAQVWSEELAAVPFEVAKQSVRNHFRKPKPREYLSLDVLMDQIKFDMRLTPEKIAEDVRSAKARGLLADSWPTRQPLPADVSARLAEARARFADEMERLALEGPANPVPFESGAVGREVPRT